MPLDAPLAIVDLETTGANPAEDRVTEIAVIEVDGGEVSGTWSTLVDPGTAIPSAIQALTGITQEMVAGAPTFRALAENLLERLEGRVFVAHNARFDYGFLRREFERAHLKFSARTLCSVKLSRRLYPQHAHHNLDSLIARHNLSCSARHRAMGDAEAVWHFLRIAADEHGAEALSVAARAVSRQPALPARIERNMIDAIPDAPGVYLFYGENGIPLYVGKSVSMRTRVMAHFAEDLRSPREQALARETYSIEFERTAGEFGALLREAELVKKLRPAYNRHLKREQGLASFVFEPHRAPGKSLRLVGDEDIEPATLPFLHGLFRSRRSASAALHGLADAHGLCLQSLGFDKSRARKGACFRHQVGRCAGLCAAKESPDAHHARLAMALAGLKTRQWPWPGPVGIVEADEDRERTEIHVVDQWCWLGVARTEEMLEDILRSATPRFDPDHYKLLTRYLLGARTPRVRPLRRLQPLSA
jgi:DNA polymerase-3 subunit epsilon